MSRRINELYYYTCEQGNYYYAFWSDRVVETMYVHNGSSQRNAVLLWNVVTENGI